MTGQKILIIEDEVDMTELLKIELESEGYAVTVVNEGGEAIAAVRRVNPDLILLDGMLPGMDGFEILKTLKEDPQMQRILVIMVSAKSFETDVQRGLSLGANRYLSKPFHSADLLQVIREVLGEKT